MAKNSRFLENLVHDIPMYPASHTPDGRIVAELHRGRKENRDFQQKLISFQEQAIDRLAQAHGGSMTIPAGDFRATETARILGDLAYEMQNAYNAHERSAQELEALGHATSEGFGQLHGDLNDLKGPPYPHENLAAMIEKNGDFFAAMCAYSKGILNRNAIGEFQQLFQEKMQPIKNVVPHIERELETKIQKEQMIRYQQVQQENEETELPIPPLKTIFDFPEIRDSLNLFRNPLGLLTSDRGKVYDHLATALKTAEQYNLPLLKSVVDFVDRFFETYRRAQQTPVPQEMLVSLGKKHLLAPSNQHEVLKYFPETRDDASLTTINYSLLDIARDTRTAIGQRNVLAALGAASLEQQEKLYRQGETAVSHLEVGNRQRKEGLHKLDTMVGQNQAAIVQRERMVEQGDIGIRQRDVSNYHLTSIVGNLAEIKDGMIDLGSIVGVFADMVEEGFEQVNWTLQRGFGATITILGSVDQRLTKIDQSIGSVASEMRLANVRLESIHKTLSNIQMEMIISRTAVVAELRRIDETVLRIGESIIDSIEKTNESLVELVELTRNSQKNEARQCFEDGLKCLSKAQSIDDIEVAYRRFCKGIETHETTIWNHYGAALTSELLGKLSEAKKNYRTLIARCENEQNDLKSLAQENMKFRKQFGNREKKFLKK